MRVLVWGAGNRGKIVADVVRACGHEIVGFVDDDESIAGQEVFAGARVLYSSDDLFEILEDDPDFDAVALGMGDNTERLRSFFEISGQVGVPAFIHPNAIHDGCEFGSGSIVGPGAVLNGATLGRCVFVDAGGVVDFGSTLGDATHVGAAAVVGDGATLGERVFVGAGATVGPAVELDADARVEAGATMVRLQF